jgi:hypothetical protein
MSLDKVYVTDRMDLELMLRASDTTSGCIYSIFEVTEDEACKAFEEKQVISHVQDPEMASRIAAVTGTKFQASPGFFKAMDVQEYCMVVLDGNDASESGLSWYIIAFMSRERNVAIEEVEMDVCHCSLGTILDALLDAGPKVDA